MPQVVCAVEETELENDEGRLVPSVIATCTKCQNTGQAFGTHEGSVKRALMQIKETCPRVGVRNFYVSDAS
jgi:hypothetical protein